MERKKLTMYQIANSAALGIIPEGYEIEWFRQTPGDVFDDSIAGDKIEINRNDIPRPDRINVKGKYIVDVERYMGWDDNPQDKDEKVDFGKVVLMTRFEIEPVKFVYGYEEGKLLEDWIKKTYDLDGYVSKRDIVFDVKYMVGDVKRTLKDLTVKGVNYENDGIVAELYCDYMMTDL